MLSLRDACIQHLSIILIPWATFVPNLVSFATSIVEKNCAQSITDPAYLMLREPKCLRFWT